MRGDRLFDLIQLLRTASGPLTAAAIAAELEVTPRTIYRDVATLQARRVPIEGAAGIGYVLRPGFDLPPLMFSMEEAEAIAVGARLVRRTGDPGLQAAAESVLAKIKDVVPDTLRAHLAAPPFFVSAAGAESPTSADLPAIRAAIREARKLRIAYADGRGGTTHRTIWPLAVAYYVQATLVYGWCELRRDYRHFRADRITAFELLEERYPPASRAIMPDWLAARTQSPTARSSGRASKQSSS